MEVGPRREFQNSRYTAPANSAMPTVFEPGRPVFEIPTDMDPTHSASQAMASRSGRTTSSYGRASSALRRSAMRSAGSSSPTDMRSVAHEIPAAASCAGVIWLCVIEAG